MGQGSHITLYNKTPYDWNRVQQHSYQMDGWEFPAVLQAGDSYPNHYYEVWTSGSTESDTGGDVTYQLGDPANSSFMLSLVSTYGSEHHVALHSLKLPKVVDHTIQMPFRHDGLLVIYILYSPGLQREWRILYH